jgi:hypothetical protein
VAPTYGEIADDVSGICRNQTHASKFHQQRVMRYIEKALQETHNCTASHLASPSTSHYARASLPTRIIPTPTIPGTV